MPVEFKKSRLKTIKNQKGMSILEVIPLIFMMAILIKSSFGFWAAIHSGVLNSIAAYNHTMATFAFRSDLTTLRPGYWEDRNGDQSVDSYKKANSRFHFVISDVSTSDKEPEATPRSFGMDRALASMPMDQGESLSTEDRQKNRQAMHKNLTDESSDYKHKKWTNFIWIKTSYGICLNPKCKED